MLRGQADTAAEDHRAKTPVLEVGDTIQVERGTTGSPAASHVAGAEVFAGPIPPGNTITGSVGDPPLGTCGQAGVGGAGGTPVPSAPYTLSEGQPDRPSTAQGLGTEVAEPADGVLTLETQDNLIVPNNLKVAAGEEITMKVNNTGAAIHNVRIAGLDGEYNTDDDFVTDPVAVAAGAEGEFTFSMDTPGVYSFQCDFHIPNMWGAITVE